MRITHKITFYVVLFVILAFVSCNHKQHVSHSFYYWRTQFNLDSTDIKQIKTLNVGHFYIHYFDVDWSEGIRSAVPKAELLYNYNTSLSDSPYTPVVFITNRTFQKISDDACDSLAYKVAKKINDITNQLEDGYINNYTRTQLISYNGDYIRKKDAITAIIKKNRKNISSEIQIDCDWTSNTKEKYFRFLKQIKILNPNKVISATIRLYPYKYYKKLGVPPVDKGMLMCYNMGNINDIQTKNSIFDINELKQYLTTKNYPLQLDVAFPVFSWHVWFRNNKLMGIVHASPIFKNDSAMSSVYRFPADTVIGGNYYREGDVLRLEYPDEKSLSDAIDLVTRHVGNYSRMAFYYWDTTSIKQYEPVIQKAFNIY